MVGTGVSSANRSVWFCDFGEKTLVSEFQTTKSWRAKKNRLTNLQENRNLVRKICFNCKPEAKSRNNEDLHTYICATTTKFFCRWFDFIASSMLRMTPNLLRSSLSSRFPTSSSKITGAHLFSMVVAPVAPATAKRHSEAIFFIIVVKNNSIREKMELYSNLLHHHHHHRLNVRFSLLARVGRFITTVMNKREWQL